MELSCAGKEHGLWGDFVSVGGHQVGKTAKNGLGTTNNAVNSGGESADHAHSAYARLMTAVGTGTVGSSGRWAVGDKGTGDYGNWDYGTSGRSAGHVHSVTSNVSIAGDNETRPVNRGVRYIIKV